MTSRAPLGWSNGTVVWVLVYYPVERASTRRPPFFFPLLLLEGAFGSYSKKPLVL